MTSYLSYAFYFLIALGVLITVHEYGHFLVARRLGVKVLKFSLGFGKPLWSRRLGRDQTEFVVAILPLGGYVKMLDEREEQVAPEERHRAFNQQSLGVRAAIVAAGPICNLLFAVLAYWLVLVWGETGLRPLVDMVDRGSIAEQAGFKSGDEILAIGNRPSPTWESVVYGLLAESLKSGGIAVRIRRDDEQETVRWLSAEQLQRITEDGQVMHRLGLSPKRPALPPVLGEVISGEAADEAGLRQGDRILTADGIPVADWSSWVELVRAKPGQRIQIEIQRQDGRQWLYLIPRITGAEHEAVGRIGASVQIPEGFQDQYRVQMRYGPVEALGEAARRTWEMSALMLNMFGRMLIGQASIDNLSGPIAIAESAGRSASYGLSYFFKFLAVVSISLGVLNLLPIPILDGGHLFYLMMEWIKGSPLSDRIMDIGQRIGLAILLSLMTLAMYVDISRFLG